eukprot:Polyplicarium_translucidae@DN2039_c0_g1_i1.p3
MHAPLNTARPCPFEILGLVPGATPEEARRSFKALALRLHPDKPGGDEGRFLEAQQAYNEVLECHESGFDRGTSRCVTGMDAVEVPNSDVHTDADSGLRYIQCRCGEVVVVEERAGIVAAPHFCEGCSLSYCVRGGDTSST